MFFLFHTVFFPLVYGVKSVSYTHLMQNELIIVSEYCDKCHIEPSFIEMLQEIGLIDIWTEGGERCLQFAQLPDVERYSRCLLYTSGRLRH